MTAFRTLRMSVLASSAATCGAFELVHDVRPEGAGPAPHLHRQHDEGLYVLEGGFEVLNDGRRFRAGAGEFFFVQRGSVHCYRALSGSARLLIFILPGGLVEFFHEVDALLADGKSSYQAMTMLAGTHDCIPQP